MKNQRFMSFSKKTDAFVDEKDIPVKYKFCINFSKQYIKDKKILDIGSWTGMFEALAIKYSSNIVAVDVEEEALDVLKSKYPNIKCVKAFSHNLPFPDSSFDVVFLWDVIEHIPVGYELASLNEIRRVLKPSGYLFLNTMNKTFPLDLLDPAYWLAGHRHYGKDHLKLMLKDAGFNVEKSYIHSSFLTAVDSIIFYIFKHILKMKKPQIKSIQNVIDKDYYSRGFQEIAIRARKIS